MLQKKHLKIIKKDNGTNGWDKELIYFLGIYLN
jgi:hypothetical protein